MEIKVYTIKLEPPRWLRNVLVYALLPIAVLLGGALAVRAGMMLKSFVPGTAIMADEVNSNFSILDGRITALESTLQVTGWTAFTPTIYAGSTQLGASDLGPVYGNWRRVGDAAEVTISARFTKSSSDTSLVVFKLPNDVEGDFGVADTSTVIGAGELWNGSVTTPAIVEFNSAVDTHAVGLDIGGAGGLQRANLGAPGASNYYVGLHFMLPIKTWTLTSPPSL